MKQQKQKHIGLILKAEVEDKGYCYKHIAKHLQISFITLKKRLKDGDFTKKQYEVLIDNRYIPQQK